MRFLSFPRYGGTMLLVVLMSAAPAQAQLNRHLDPHSWDRNVAGLVQKYCYSCHRESKASGGVNLAQDVNPRLILEHRQTWEEARSMLEFEAMPPEAAKQPTPEERKIMVEFLAQTLDSFDCASVQDPGPPPFRRLTNVEYNNTIHDLTGLDLRPADNFSPDPSSFGFDSIGDALTLSPVLIEQYHQAAREVSQAILEAGKDQSRHPLLTLETEQNLPPRERARQLITRFATKAFRRPVEPEYVEKLLRIYDLSTQRGDAEETATGHAFTAVLISPRFLVRVEASRAGEAAAYPVDDYELASRLSYFLWSRPPDDVLLGLAAEGKLSSPQVLEEQTRRMLADPRSSAIAEHFFGQWLELRRLATSAPDELTFPEFQGALKQAVADEVRMMLMDLIQNNRPVRDLLDARDTYLNQPLAEWYGIEGVQGNEMRRVELTDRRRGGLLTTAAVLMLQSDPARTNIPRRGNFIAGRILGDAPPPPPPDVPALTEPEGDGKKLSLRERLEQHRQKAECASCHARIDPFGFSLENYDAAGRWRTTDAGASIDPSGELPGGQKLSGPEDLKDVLLKQESRFTRTLLQNLLIYALGRSLQPEDECVIRDAMKIAEERDGRFNELVVSIVQSYPFRHRRNADD